MFLKRRRLITTALFVLLAAMLVTGCGNDSGTSESDSTSPVASESNGSGSDASALSPDGVVMVNGKEFTKADLAEAVNEDLAYIQSTLESGGSYSISDGTSDGYTDLVEVPKPGTPEYTFIESSAVARLVSDEIIQLEAEKMGLTASEAEIDEALNNPDLYRGVNTRDEARNAVINRKLYDEVTKDAPLGADGVDETATIELDNYDEETMLELDNYDEETAMLELDNFSKWLDEAKSKYEIIYADQYKPTTTTTSTTP